MQYRVKPSLEEIEYRGISPSQNRKRLRSRKRPFILILISYNIQFAF